MTGNVAQKLRREEESEDINLITKYMELKSLTVKECQEENVKKRKINLRTKMENNNLERVRRGQEDMKT